MLKWQHNGDNFSKKNKVTATFINISGNFWVFLYKQCNITINTAAVVVIIAAAVGVAYGTLSYSTLLYRPVPYLNRLDRKVFVIP